MRIKELNRVRKNRWYVAFKTDVSLLTNSEFFFDRWRIYGNTKSMKVAAFNDTANTSKTDAKGRYIDYPDELSEMIGSPQLFSSNGGYEHDFTLDLSTASTSEVIICVSGFPENLDMTQIYTSPTGFAATRNKNAQLKDIYLKQVNPSDYLRLDNQPGIIVSSDLTPSGQTTINALNVLINNSNIPSNVVDNIIIYTDRNGKSNGVLNYSGNSAPTTNSRAAYDSLISKGWTITGTVPPTS